MTPKDVILELLRRRGVRGGLGRVFEFYGPGVANIDVTGRTTICNMIAELGATAGIFLRRAYPRVARDAAATRRLRRALRR